MKRFWPVLSVFVFAAVVLSFNLWNVGIASGYIDPVLHFGAQDEATYTREAISMARDGGWMTPSFLGRWVFEKPPLLMWLSAASMKIFGVGRLAARLPCVLAGALICALFFAIVRRRRTPCRTTMAALATAAMALSSQVLFIMSRHNMTDILLAAAGVCAFAIVLHDPDLGRPAALAGFVVAAAAGIMAKSVAGILILAVMFVVVGPRRPARALIAAASALVLASSWFVYNFVVHRDWFLADMGFQIITIGSTAQQTSSENHVWFYILRILESDFVPLFLAVSAIPALASAIRRREPAAVLATSYFGIYFAALMIFHFQSEQYLAWFVPSLILIAGLYSPLLNERAAPVWLAIICSTFAVKLANPGSDFGISIRSGSTIAAAPTLSRYCQQHRATDLYILGVDDEFYSAVLPLHHVHYGWIDALNIVAREHPHLAYLGILIPAEELNQLGDKLPLFRERLRAWGLDTTHSIATGISARDVAELRQIIREHPGSDFLVAPSILPDPTKDASHHVVTSQSDFVLLESNSTVSTELPAWSCEM